MTRRALFARVLASVAALPFVAALPMEASATTKIAARGRASGGPVYAGVPYMVGESGPEVFWPDAAGTIVPNLDLREIEEMRLAALRLGQETAFSAEEAARAMEELAKAGAMAATAMAAAFAAAQRAAAEFEGLL